VNAARLQDSKEADDKLWAVWQEHRDPVAFRRAQLRDQGSEAIAQTIEFGVAGLAPIEIDGGLGRRSARPFTQILRDRAFAEKRPACGGPRRASSVLGCPERERDMTSHPQYMRDRRLPRFHSYLLPISRLCAVLKPTKYRFLLLSCPGKERVVEAISVPARSIALFRPDRSPHRLRGR
jgi:hypothetical protein